MSDEPTIPDGMKYVPFPSPPKPSIIEALAAVAADVREVRKADRNQHSNYNFRGIDAVVNAVGPAFRTHGVVCIPVVEDVQPDTVQTTSGKPQTRWMVKVRYQFHGPAGDTLDSVVWGEAWDSGDKGLAQAMSVAYRTCLLQALTIPTDAPDPDEVTHTLAPAPPPPEPVMMATPQVVDMLTAGLAALSEAELERYGAWRTEKRIPSLKRGVTEDQADLIAGWLDELKAPSVEDAKAQARAAVKAAKP